MIVADAVIRTARNRGPVEVVTVRPAWRKDSEIRVSHSSIRSNQAFDRVSGHASRTNIENL